MVREEGAPKSFRGTDKGSSQFTSSLGNEEVLLVAKQAIRSFKMGVG
jgi:hypothetical protein